MNAVVPMIHDGAVLVVYALSQTEHYDPLPASVDRQSTVMTEWEPTIEELALLLAGGRVRLWLLHTGVAQGRKLTPMSLQVIEKP